LTNFNTKIQLCMNISNLLRGIYKPNRYGDIVLPFVVLKRFDDLLKDTKKKVLDNKNAPELIKKDIAGEKFYNDSNFDFENLLDDPENIKENFNNYLNGYSENIRDIVANFDLNKEIKKLEKNNLLYLIIKEFNKINLHPEVVSNEEMGYIFEELIRKFSENAEAGDHYTPSEIVKLMAELVIGQDKEYIKNPNNIFSIADFAAGTGKMVFTGKKYIKKKNPKADTILYGQEINPQSYAICKSDLLIQGDDPTKIKLGNTLTNDMHKDVTVRYGLMNPPFGVSWSNGSKKVKDEHKQQGFNGRFGAGTPRVSDGSLLFLEHLISKAKTDEHGSRFGIIFNSSPLFTGDADSGESEIRRWIIENDYLEAIVALPKSSFYNTSIGTFLFVLSTNKPKRRKNKIQLIDASSFYSKLRKSLGNKSNEMQKKHIDKIVSLYEKFENNKHSKIFDKEEFGYLKVRIERPLKLNFKITEDRIENIYSENTFSKLFDETKYKKLKKLSEAPEFKSKDKKKLEKLEKGKKLQEKILNRLRENIDQDKVWKNRKEFKEILKDILGDLDLKRSLMKAVRQGLAKRDENADYCKKRGKIESDTDLRDYERIPFSHKVEGYKQDYSDFVEKEKDNITAYFENEVKPHVPEAWVDYSYTRVGYEIPFTRYFYEFEELEPSHEIKEDIEKLEAEINEIMQKVLG